MDESEHRIPTVTQRALLCLAAWAALVAALSATGLLRRVTPWGIPPFIVAGMALPVLAYFRSPALRLLVGRIGLRALTGFHIWRAVAAGVFFWYGAHGLLPGQFVAHAAWGDLLVSLAALVLILLPLNRSVLWLFHGAGFFDLLFAMATAMALTRADPQSMQNIASLPVVLIPLFGVGVTATAHFVAFDWLTRRRG